MLTVCTRESATGMIGKLGVDGELFTSSKAFSRDSFGMLVQVRCIIVSTQICTSHVIPADYHNDGAVSEAMFLCR